MTTQTEVLKMALEALENNKQKHHYCEDTWYSCPKHEEGCANDSEGDACNCGADEINAQFDKAITAINDCLTQQSNEQVEPVADQRTAWDEGFSAGNNWRQDVTHFWETHDYGSSPAQPENPYTHPPVPTEQPKPLTFEQVEDCFPEGPSVFEDAYGDSHTSPRWLHAFARAIEAAHGIKP